MLQISTAGLDDRETAFVIGYCNTGDVGANSLAAGYSHKQTGYEVLRRPRVQKALRDHFARRVKIEGARIGIETLIELAGKGNPAGVRFQAAKWLAEAAGYGAKDADTGRAKPLAEMTEEELAGTIERLKAVVADPSHPETGRMPPPGPGETQIDQ